MKVRTGFVSNSSSSSFCIVGIVVTENNFKLDTEKAKKILADKGLNKDEIEEMDDNELLISLFDWCANDVLKGLTRERGLGDYSEDDILLGLSISKMTDDMTLGQFKQMALEKLKSLGFTGELKDIGILIDGGYEG